MSTLSHASPERRGFLEFKIFLTRDFLLAYKQGILPQTSTTLTPWLAASATCEVRIVGVNYKWRDNTPHQERNIHEEIA